jgi:PTS system nitrogen regulatory IIA component
MQLTVRDVVGLFKVNEKTVYRWIKEDAMPATLIGEQYRFGRAELLEWAMARQINLPADLFAEAEKGAVKPAGFLDALVAGGVHGGIVAHDRDSALQAVVRTMPLSDDADREFLYDMLLARETLSSTGMGDGIAIPHARNPMVLHVPKSMISLCLLDQPVEFGAVDGKPVYALFSLISITVREHLHLLSRLAFALHDEGFKGAVLRRASKDVVLAEARRVEQVMLAKDEASSGEKPQ